MKSKIISGCLLTLVLAISLVAAADYSVSPTNLQLSKSMNSATFTITNNAVTQITVTVPNFPDISDGDTHTILITQSDSGAISIPVGGTKDITVSYSDGTTDQEVTVDFISGFCDEGELEEEYEPGEFRSLEIKSIKDKSSADDWEWRPLDEVEVQVEIKFNSDDKDDDIDGVIEIALWDTEENEFIDLDDDEDLEIEFSLDEGEDVKEIFTVIIPVEDLEDSTSRYKLYVKAYEEDDEDIVCVDTEDDELYVDIKIEKESHDVVIDEIITTTPVPCGEEVEVTMRVSNIGTKDQDKVQVTLMNTDLGIDLKSDIFELDEGDSERISFTFLVPEDASEDTYTLVTYSAFKFSKSSDNFRERSKDFKAGLEVENNCIDTPTDTPGTPTDTTKNVQINAALDPETPKAVAGEQIIVRATLENTGTVDTTYTVTATGYSAWSELVEIDPPAVTLTPGESRIVNIILDIDEGVTGTKTFMIKSSFDGRSEQQEVELRGIGEGEPEIDAFTEHLKQNWFIYLIVIINIILIIAIIAVIRRMVAPRPA